MSNLIYRSSGFKRAVKALKIIGKIVGIILAVFGLYQIYDFFHDRSERVIVSPSVASYGVESQELRQVITVVNKTNEAIYDVRIDVTITGAPQTVSIEIRPLDYYSGGPAGLASRYSIEDSIVYYIPEKRTKGKTSANATLMKLGPKESRNLLISTMGTPTELQKIFTARVNVSSTKTKLSSASKFRTVSVEGHLVLWSNMTWDTGLDKVFNIIDRPWILDGGLEDSEDKNAFFEASALFRRHDISAAKAKLEDRLRNSESVAMLRTLSAILNCEGKYQESLIYAQRILRIEPDNEDGHLMVLENASKLKNMNLMSTSIVKLNSIQSPTGISMNITSRRFHEFSYYIYLLDYDPKMAEEILEKVCSDYGSGHLTALYFAARSIHANRPNEAILYLNSSKKALPSRFWELHITNMIACGLKIPPDPKWNDLIVKIRTNKIGHFETCH